jgi:hypothetical protein
VNNSHIHDMGKWVFAISFLWSYLYFSQFMLIWYSNIPEEVTYFNNGSIIIRCSCGARSSSTSPSPW